MRWHKKTVRLVIIVLLTALLAALSYATWKLLYIVPSEEIQQPDFSTQFSAARIVGRWKGERQWSLMARSLRDEGDVLLMEGIEQGSIYQGEKELFTFEASKATWQRRRDEKECNDLLLTGGVTIYQDGQPVLKTKQLQWEAASAQLTAPDPVEFTYQSNSLTAGKMMYDANLETITLQTDVQVLLNDGSLMKVDGKIVYNMQTGDFTASGPTHIVPASP